MNGVPEVHEAKDAKRSSQQLQAPVCGLSLSQSEVMVATQEVTTEVNPNREHVFFESEVR